MVGFGDCDVGMEELESPVKIGCRGERTLRVG